MVLSPEQASYLIGMGINMLVAAGSLTIKDMTEEEFKAEKAAHEDSEGDSNSGVTFAVDPKLIN